LQMRTAAVYRRQQARRRPRSFRRGIPVLARRKCTCCDHTAPDTSATNYCGNIRHSKVAPERLSCVSAWTSAFLSRRTVIEWRCVGCSMLGALFIGAHSVAQGELLRFPT
jgi:hypothetical protein